MTQEEAIELIGGMKSDLSDFYDDKDLTALDMAISALQKNESAEEWYKLFCEKWNEGDYVCNVPKGMTNGEVIKEIYRHHSDMNCGSNGEYIHVWSNDGNCQMTIHKDFWNAPYQKGGE